MTASIHYLPPGHGAARRALQDKKTPAWIKEIAATMTGDVAPEDLIMAEPGKHHIIIQADHLPPVLDYAPKGEPQEEPAFSWLGEFLDGMAGAIALVIGGAVLGSVGTILVALRFL